MITDHREWTKAVVRGAVLGITVTLSGCRADGGGDGDGGLANQTEPALPMWTLLSPPELSLGRRTGGGADAFSRVVGAVLLSDGMIVIADQRPGELRYFDGAGNHKKTVGRRGAGPGEFRTLVWVGTCRRDSVFTYDLALHRISVFDRDGDFVRTFTLHSPNPALSPGGFDCDASGRFLVVARPESMFRPDKAVGPYEDSVQVALAGANGDVTSVVGEFPGVERYRFPNSDMPRFGGRNLVYGISHERVYVGSGQAFSIGIFAVDGSIRGHLERPWARTAVTSEAWRTFIRSTLRPYWTDERRRTVERRMLTVRPPSTFPAYDSLLVDPRGNVWVREFRPRPGPREWTVFAADGPAIATLRLPEAEAAILHVGWDRVVVREIDTLGVHYVRVYGLGLGSPAPRHARP